MMAMLLLAGYTTLTHGCFFLLWNSWRGTREAKDRQQPIRFRTSRVFHSRRTNLEMSHCYDVILNLPKHFIAGTRVGSSCALATANGCNVHLSALPMCT